MPICVSYKQLDRLEELLKHHERVNLEEIDMIYLLVALTELRRCRKMLSRRRMSYKIKRAEANTHLIAAAPDLLEACKSQHEAIDRLFALLISKNDGFFPSKSGQPWEALLRGNKAITKAEG